MKNKYKIEVVFNMLNQLPQEQKAYMYSVLAALWLDLSAIVRSIREQKDEASAKALTDYVSYILDTVDAKQAQAAIHAHRQKLEEETREQY